MKLVLLLLIFGLLHVSASTYGQHVHLTRKNAPMKTVLKAIASQTGHQLVYTEGLLKKASPVSVLLNGQSLEEALELAFRDQPITYAIERNTIIVKERPAPTIATSLILAYPEIKGRVVDSTGSALVGASVRVLNAEGQRTTLQTITDREGNFLLRNVPDDATLEITFVGHIGQTVKAAAEVGTVVLRAVPSELEEVEVTLNTGFQHIPKERATGAFSHIDNETFNEQVSMDVLSRLEAVANGVDVSRITTMGGANMGIRIRGQSTFATGALRDPLIILDNFPFEGDLGNINPNDVENITLLKDAAAASIWGVRAGNGVIVITTKRARKKQPIKIDINSNITVQDKPDLMYLDLMTPEEFIEVERFLFDSQHRFNDTASVLRPAFSPVYEILFRQRAGNLTEAEANALIGELGKTDVRDEYLHHMYEPALRQQYALNIHGGSDNAAWYFSAGYDRNKSDLAAKNDRLTVTFRNTYTPIRNLQFETGLMYVQSQSFSGNTGFSNGLLPPYTRFSDEQGNALPANSKSYTTYRNLLIDTLAGGKLMDWNYYPLTDDDYQIDHSTLNHTLFNAGINYKPLDWFALNLKYQYGRQQSKRSFLREEESYFARDMINGFSYYTETGTIAYNVPRGGILDLSSELLQSHNLRGQLDISHRWNRHAVNVLVGIEGSHKNTSNDGNRTYGYNPKILTFSQVDYLTAFPNFIHQYGMYIPQNHYFNDRTNRFVSTFFNGAYTLDSKYIFSVSARRDASNLFGVNVNDRWNLLWSAGLSWELSKEQFYNIDLLPYLRIRTTHGFSGNTDLSRSAVTTISYGGIASQRHRYPTASVSQNANPELRWEKVRMTNFAVDFRFKNNRLSGSFDFFLKHGVDLFGPDPVDYTTGISGTITRNISELKGKGLDLQLTSLNVAQKDWQWNTNLNFSYYDDKVVRWYRPTLNPGTYVSIVGSPTNIEGERMYAMYSYSWAGLDPQTGTPRGYLNGEVSNNYAAIGGADSQMEDLVNHGSSIPLLFGTIGNTLNYKNLGISFNLMFKFNYFIRTNAIDYFQLFQQGRPQSSEWNQRWQRPGDEIHTSVPSMVYPAGSGDGFYAQSEIKVQRGDHIRFQYVNLHYDLANQRLLNAHIRNLRLYFNMANMGFMWKRGNYNHDPLYGYDNIPPSMSYSLGLKANF